MNEKRPSSEIAFRLPASVELTPLNTETRAMFGAIKLVTSTYQTQIEAAAALTKHQYGLGVAGEIFEYNNQVKKFSKLFNRFYYGEKYYLHTFGKEKRKDGAFTTIMAEISPYPKINAYHPDSLFFYASVETKCLEQDASIATAGLAIKSKRMYEIYGTQRKITEAGIHLDLKPQFERVRTTIAVARNKELLTVLQDTLPQTRVVPQTTLRDQILFLRDLPKRKKQ